MSRTLIAGLGDLGSRVAQSLQAQGDEVTGLRRSSSTGPAGIRVVQTDLRSGPPATQPAERLVICLTPAQRSARGYRQTYLQGVRHLLEMAPFSKLVFVSSSSVWGHDDGRWIDRDTPPAPASWRGEILLEAEAQVLAHPGQAILLRLAGIYGPGRTFLQDRVKTGEPVADPAAWTNRIHRDDAVRLIVELLAQGAGGVHIGVDQRPARRLEVMNWLAARMGCPPLSAGRGEAQGKRLRHASLAGGSALLYADYRAGYSTLPGLKSAPLAIPGHPPGLIK